MKIEIGSKSYKVKHLGTSLTLNDDQKREVRKQDKSFSGWWRCAPPAFDNKPPKRKITLSTDLSFYSSVWDDPKSKKIYKFYDKFLKETGLTQKGELDVYLQKNFFSQDVDTGIHSIVDNIGKHASLLFSFVVEYHRFALITKKVLNNYPVVISIPRKTSLYVLQTAHCEDGERQNGVIPKDKRYIFKTKAVPIKPVLEQGKNLVRFGLQKELDHANFRLSEAKKEQKRAKKRLKDVGHELENIDKD